MSSQKDPPKGGRLPPTSPRGVLAFDLDGTLLDSMRPIGTTASQVLHEVFGTSREEAARQYYRTTGKPFELQLRELYPEATPFELQNAANKFHELKVKNAYAHASFFPEVPKLLKRLDQAGWKLVISTGAEREMAEVLLEREGLGFFFEEVRGAKQGTKDAHLRAFHEKWPHVPLVLVGDSQFDMETGRKVKGVTLLGRACLLPSWSISPADLRRWGATWADYHLDRVPEVLEELFPRATAPGTRVPKVLTGRGPGRNLRVYEGGATTYVGKKKCNVASCRHRATWHWKNTLLCDDHLREEARSARHRNDFLKEARAAARPRKREEDPSAAAES
ncbi:MAG: HAD family hydrolase [Euryarchaeota archaeon]|nr:HAD family hydrolase [Euryarchaeota archaeon]MDE1837351.1 HAD family hydrolase [Euryarchaeota archaeon]MDE1880917.1 HAD family hydrolase [Euryarchaeota archaeon]MDE2045629.1 HAD family hydrolase [Thermoplasmata archaeon]